MRFRGATETSWILWFLSGMIEDERFDESAASNFSFSGKFNVGGWSHGPILQPNWRKFWATQGGRKAK